MAENFDLYDLNNKKIGIVSLFADELDVVVPPPEDVVIAPTIGLYADGETDVQYFNTAYRSQLIIDKSLDEIAEDTISDVEKAIDKWSENVKNV